MPKRINPEAIIMTITADPRRAMAERKPGMGNQSLPLLPEPHQLPPDKLPITGGQELVRIAIWL
jgi:hypothetical protein